MKQENLFIIIPVLNEAKNLQWLLPDLCKLYEVVIVDNGSKDGSYEIAQSYTQHVLKEPRKGYGSAVLKGLQYLTQLNSDPVVVVFDADGSSPFTKIDEIANHIKTSQYDLVIAQRDTRKPGAMPIHAYWGNLLQTRLIYWLAGVSYTDMGPLRAMRLSSFSRLNMRDPSWAWNIEMQLKAAIFKLKIHEIPIVYEERKYGRSKISGSLLGSIRAGFKILFGVFYYYFDGLVVKAKASS